jgi:predicted O-linked N-acetylglucosamine transferase (SPINDLY family)
MAQIPSRTEQTMQLIAEYARQGRLSEAAAMAGQLCRQAPQDGQAWFLLGAIFGQTGNLDEAEAALQQSACLSPGMAVVHYNLGVIRQKLGRLDQAAQSMRKAIALNQQFAEAHQELGNVLAQQGKLERAQACYRRALEIRPQYPQSHSNLAAALYRAGDLEASEGSYRRALQLAPGLIEAAVGLADVLIKQGRGDEAVAVLRSAVPSIQDNVSLLKQFGRMFLAAGDNANAESCFARALAAAPGDADAATGYGNALTEAGRYQEAEKAYQMALDVEPDSVTVLVNLGRVNRELGNQQESIDILHRALAIDPQLAEAHYNLANNYNDLFRQDAAEQSYRKALELSPQFAEAAVNLGSMLFSQGRRIEEAIHWYRKAWELRPDYDAAASNYLMALNYGSGLAPEYIYEQHAKWGERFAGIGTFASRIRATTTDRPLKLGLVSGDFRNHSVAFFIEALMRHHSRDKLQITCYANVSKPDSHTQTLREMAEYWCDIGQMTDDTAAARIAQDGIDILMDLSGHTGGNRLGVFARKPAPLQLTYLGYPNTTGLKAIDFRLVDAVTDPPDQPVYATEGVVRLPGIFICYTPPQDAPKPQPETVEVNRPVTFGSFNSPGKISDDLLQTWVDLLARVPESRLFLKGMAFMDAGVSRRLVDVFAAHGVARHRLEVRAWTRDITEHLALYHNIDIALDTYPYNGTTTTCEALWMGVPVVTLSGAMHASRVTHSILASIGKREWVASSAEDYVEIAVSLAQKVHVLRRERAAIRKATAASLLTDAVQHTANMQRLLTDLWQGVLSQSQHGKHH